MIYCLFRIEQSATFHKKTAVGENAQPQLFSILNESVLQKSALRINLVAAAVHYLTKQTFNVCACSLF